MKSGNKITRVQHRVCIVCGGDIYSSNTSICLDKECRRKIVNMRGMKSYWHIRNNPQKWKLLKEKIREYQRLWLNDILKIRRKVGLCLFCGISLEKGSSYKKCDECRKQHIEYCQSFWHKRINNKLCIYCSKPIYKDFVMCQECNKKNLDKVRRITKRKREEGVCYSCNAKANGYFCDVCYLNRKMKRDMENKYNCWRCHILLEKGSIYRSCDKCREYKKERMRDRRKRLKTIIASQSNEHPEPNPLSPTHTTLQSPEVK